jgi:hypothetical protein
MAKTKIPGEYLADGGITVGKMAANSVDSDQYVDGSIDAIHIADGAVTSAKLDTNIAIAGTLGVTGDITGTLATAAQPNITSVGSLTALDVAGTPTFDGLTVDGSGTLSGNLQIQAASSGAKLTVGNLGDTARAATFQGGSILIDGGAATEIIIGDGNVAYMSIQTTDDATAMKIRNFSGSADLVTIERASGNVGIAAVPSGEAAAAHVVRLGDRVCISEYDDGSNPEQFNLFHNSNSSEKYIETGTASVIQQRAGEMVFYNAASGTAGAAISWAERLRILAGGGITFNGDTAAANALDDYEEGTWIPTIASGGWTLSATNRATYTKIGNRVTVQTYIDITGTANSDNLRIGGLPFNCINNGWSTGAADISHNSKIGTYCRVRSNEDDVEFYVASGSTAADREQLAGNSIGAGYIIFTVVYETS